MVLQWGNEAVGGENGHIVVIIMIVTSTTTDIVEKGARWVLNMTIE